MTLVDKSLKCENIFSGIKIVEKVIEINIPILGNGKTVCKFREWKLENLMKIQEWKPAKF